MMHVKSIERSKSDIFILVQDDSGSKYSIASPLTIFECWLVNEERLFKPIMVQDKIELFSITMAGYWKLDKEIILADMIDFIEVLNWKPCEVPKISGKLLKSIAILLLFGIISIAYYICS